MIKARVASIFVSDQKEAEVFYTQVLGFVKKADKPLGEHRWLTVGDQDSDFELLLEPNVHPAAERYQSEIFAAGIPASMFYVDDLAFQYSRLSSLGVEFKSEPMEFDGVKLAILNDTCGNWITLCQTTEGSS